MSRTVLDASALLAFIFAEPGAPLVADELNADCEISAVNWSEVLQKIAHRGGPADQLSAWVLALGPRVEPFDRATAAVAAGLYPRTAEFGLSLGDRACLALARQRAAPAFTADRRWADIPDLGVDVRLIR